MQASAKPSVWRSRCGWLVVVLAMAASPLSARAQSTTGGNDRSPALRMAPISAQLDTGSARPVVSAVMRSDRGENSPPSVTLAQGAMGGMPMAMIMTGDTMFEMAAGACAAGIVVGVIASATVPAFTGSMVLANSAIGCGIGVVATLAGMAGMSAARAIAGND
jgi:hypothetical protein